MNQTRIYWEWCGTPVRQFRTGVSLHSHTLYSRETLDFIYRLAQRIACIDWVLKKGEARYRVRHGGQLDLRRAWWTPPCAPYDAWLLEKDQIERRLQLNALVSLTDHDSIEAPVSLRTIESCCDLPVSVEWTIPCAGTFFHLGVHNLPADAAPQIFGQLEELTAGHKSSDLKQLLEHLATDPETLVVFNHPCWMKKGSVRRNMPKPSPIFFAIMAGSSMHSS